MREPSPMAGEKTIDITLSRTVIPTLPTGYLSRRHLFPLIDNEPSGTTVVVAPGGYGKTSLIAEWAQNQKNSVIWMTVANGDTTNEMSAMMIAATRRVIPEFAPWFESEQPIRPTDVVRRWGNELLQTGRNYIFVLDNLRSEMKTEVAIANQLIEQFPSNVHFVAIRREEVDGLYSTSASRGPVKIISVNDLRFTDEEIERFAANSGLALTEVSRKIIHASAGWPAAASLLLALVQTRGEEIEIENILSSSIEPLRALVMLVLNSLEAEVKDVCEKLSVLEVFTLDEAKLILGDNYSFDLINSIAHTGEIFRLSRDPQTGFVFSPMVRQIFLENLRRRPDEKLAIHQKLIHYFETRGFPSAAIDHAFEAGDEAKISDLFPNAARAKQAQGHGGELLRWAAFAGDTSNEGELKKSTVKATGHLADLDFGSAQVELNKLRLLSENSPAREFFQQFATAASCYSLLSLGNFEELELAVATLGLGTEKSLLGVDDQINVLRLLATKRYIFSESAGVEETFLLAQTLASKTTLYTSHTFLMSIEAMHLHQRGEYKRAHEIAAIARSEYLQNRFVGNHGPLDVMFVIARCLLEFSRLQEAIVIFDQIQSTAFQWKQWHWFFTCDKHIIEYLSYTGNFNESLERVKRARDLVGTIDSPNHLSAMIDISEMYVRRKLKDFDRLEKLVNRTPNTRDTRIYKMAVDEFRGRKNISDDAKKLPEQTPRDIIWRHLTDASLHLDSEQIALPAMHKAMQAGSVVGARETFLRQRDEMGNLVIRIANDFPTVYNEELAAAMAERMKERGNMMATGNQALTKRELEILRQLSTGRTLTLIAAELHISQNTMKTHLKNLYRKIGAESRHDAVEKAKSSFLI